MTWIGKILNPLFLVLLFGLVIVALIYPVQPLSASVPEEAYLTPGRAFLAGFLEGYNTLDALAGLAFGIVIVNEIRRIGIEEPTHIASATVRSGIFSCLSMGIVYFLISLISTQSASLCGECTNGSEVLGVIARHYYGSAGTVLLFAIVTMACLKTAVGLVTSCSEAFVKMFPNGPKYRIWAVLFVAISVGIANLGLTTIVNFCVPVLMFLYPLAIVLILLSLCGRFFQNNGTVYMITVTATLVAALFDFFQSLISLLDERSIVYSIISSINAVASRYLPLFHFGLGWLVPALAGFIISFVLYKRNIGKTKE